MDKTLEEIIKKIQDPKIGQAIALITRYGGIEGEHHTRWLLDQALRNLLGQDLYLEWRQAYNSYKSEIGEANDKWDEGIAP